MVYNPELKKTKASVLDDLLGMDGGIVYLKDTAERATQILQIEIKLMYMCMYMYTFMYQIYGRKEKGSFDNIN